MGRLSHSPVNDFASHLGTIDLSPDGGSHRTTEKSLITWNLVQTVESIETHIAKDREELAKAKATGDQAKVRHYASELEDLESYRSHHPEEHNDPTPLELHCDLNPEAPECRIYDD